MRARISMRTLARRRVRARVMRPCSGFDEPEQRLEHRALAGAVRAEQADRAAARNARRDVP